LSLVIGYLTKDLLEERVMDKKNKPITKGFEDLRVYQLSEELADEIWFIVMGWRGLAQDTVGKQLVRAVDSIGANIAEGTGRGSYQDNRRFVKIARGSLYETKHWLRRAFKRKLLTSDQTARLKPMLDELAPKLNAYLNSIGSSSEQNPANDQ
jgi:four helix bundle protein